MLFTILGTAQKGDKGEILGVSPGGYWYEIKVSTYIVGMGIAWSAVDHVDLSNPTGRQLPVATPPLENSLSHLPMNRRSTSVKQQPCAGIHCILPGTDQRAQRTWI
jgi:hypothetical protein